MLMLDVYFDIVILRVKKYENENNKNMIFAFEHQFET